MSSHKKKTPAEDLLDSLLNEVGEETNHESEGVLNLDTDEELDLNLATVIDSRHDNNPTVIDSRNNDPTSILQRTVVDSNNAKIRILNSDEFSDKTSNGYEATQIHYINNDRIIDTSESTEINSLFDKNKMTAPKASLFSKSLNNSIPVSSPTQVTMPANTEVFIPEAMKALPKETAIEPSENTFALNPPEPTLAHLTKASANSDQEKTLAVTGFQIKSETNFDDKIKVSVGKPSRSPTGFASWGGSGVEGNLSQADNLRMAQDKILELENENERLRRHNEELIAASEIIKERSDLLTAQLTEYRNDRDGLELSFKNEMTLLKNHVGRKDVELQKAQFKVDELESRLKFDMKKIRVRERELENRLELVRAEKNAISKNKDEQILDLRRKMDVIQMEVDSYRQKCVELNKQIENSQDSFKRTTRALRLAMANLELQEENKAPLKKAE